MNHVYPCHIGISGKEFVTLPFMSHHFVILKLMQLVQHFCFTFVYMASDNLLLSVISKVHTHALHIKKMLHADNKKMLERTQLSISVWVNSSILVNSFDAVSDTFFGYHFVRRFFQSKFSFIFQNILPFCGNVKAILRRSSQIDFR